ncbi:MAG: L,D-transpeptidase [Deltaproteobacteria bacterium]|nr:MAG: L,D-transpeptidase [Deltaproteobacteria bacterium]
MIARIKEIIKKSGKDLSSLILPVILILAPNASATISPQNDDGSSDLMIVINLPAYNLKLYQGDEILRTYKIAIGSPKYPTPSGEKSIRQVVLNPWWYPPKESEWAKEAEDTPPGDDNPLGRAKLPLDGGGYYLLHGTSNPDSIGKAVSHGCIRLNNADIMELAEIILTLIPNRYQGKDISKFREDKNRTYLVNLELPVRVKIKYETIEVRESQVLIHPDIYRKGVNCMTALLQELATTQINAELIDEENLVHYLKRSRQETQQISLAQIMAVELKRLNLAMM